MSGPDEVRWDPEGGAIDAARLEGLDGVVHLAGEGIADKRWNDDHKRRIRDSRVKGTSLLGGALAGLDRRPTVLVSGSAIGYYGDREDEILTEDSSPQSGDFLADVCVDWEAATAPAEAAGIRVAHIRTGIVLDREGGALAKMLPLFKFGIGGRLGSGKQWMSWISLADEVGAIRFLLDNNLAGPFNLTAPEPVTNQTFTTTLGRVLHRPTVLPVPSFGPKLLLGSELADNLLYSGQRVLPSALEAAGFKFEYPELRGALEDLLKK